MKTFASTAAVLALAASANAGFVFQGLGTGPGPDSLGGLPLMQFGPDDRPLFSDVDGVDGPCGPISFSPSLTHFRIGQGWATWSHGYTGDVYSTGAGTEIEITLPDDSIAAFCFYVEPNPFGLHTISVVADGVVGQAYVVEGDSGAFGVGISAPMTHPGGGPTKIHSIIVSSDVGFAIGEFSCALSVPTPGVMALAGIAGLAGLRRRR